jgi:hypothetical protein
MWPYIIPFIPILTVLSSVDQGTNKTIYIHTTHAAVLTLIILSFVDQRTRLRIYVQRKDKNKINQKQKKFKLSFAFLV